MSFIVVSVDQIEKLVASEIQRIRDVRKKRDDVILSKTMKKKHLFSRKQFTKDDAVRFLQRWDTDYPSSYAWRELHRLNCIQLQIENSEDGFMFIGLDDAALLWGNGKNLYD